MRNWASKKTSAITGNAGIAAINWLRGAATEEFKKSRHFDPPANISGSRPYGFTDRIHG